MGATTFYGLPYPDPTSTVDVPRDIKALADKLELWKNGLTVPSGNVIAGSTTDTVGRIFAARKLEAGVPTEGQFYVMAGGAVGIVLMKNSVESARIRLNDDLSVAVGTSGGTYRPLPFATFGWQGQVSVSNSTTGSIAVTYPTGRFTAGAGAGGPLPFATPLAGGSSSYSATTNSNATTGTTVLLRHINDAVATATIWVSLLAVQMTPGSAAGFTRATPPIEDGVSTHIVTCHEAGCENADVPIPIGLTDLEQAVVCGPCGQPITDVVAASKKRKR